MKIPKEVADNLAVEVRKYGLPDGSKILALIERAEIDMANGERTLKNISISEGREGHHMVTIGYEEKKNWWSGTGKYSCDIFTERNFHYQKIGEPKKLKE